MVSEILTIAGSPGTVGEEGRGRPGGSTREGQGYGQGEESGGHVMLR